MSVWSGLWQSAYSAPAYRAVAAGGAGRMLGYLALLAAVAAAVTTVGAHLIVSRGVRDFKSSQWWDANLPEITIAKGRASSQVAQPFRKEFGGGAMVFILDTTGTVTELEPGAPNTVLVTATQLIVRQDQRGQTRVYDLSRFPNVVINQRNIEAWLDGISRWIWIAMAVGLFFGFWVAKLFQVLFWSVLGLIVNAVSGRRLGYGAIFNIGIFALTVPWAFDLLRMAASWGTLLFNLMSLALYVGYLVWGILAQPKAAASASSTAEPIHAS